MMKESIAVLAAASLAIAPMPIAAESAQLTDHERDEVTAGESKGTIDVSYSDLDLTKEDDHTRLNRRIKVAVRKVCKQAKYHPLAERAARKKCRKQTTQMVEKSVDLAVAKAREGQKLVQSTRTDRR